MPNVLNNAKVVSVCGQRLIALNKFVKPKTAMTVNGQPVKPADLTAIYQNAIDTRTALITLRAAINKALSARDDAEATRLATDEGLKAWVVTQFGARSQEAQEFGFLPTKVGEKSVATKAVAVEKCLATRQARGTRGKRQKERIKGTLVAPATPAEPAANGVAGAHGPPSQTVVSA